MAILKCQLLPWVYRWGPAKCNKRETILEPVLRLKSLKHHLVSSLCSHSHNGWVTVGPRCPRRVPERNILWDCILEKDEDWTGMVCVTPDNNNIALIWNSATTKTTTTNVSAINACDKKILCFEVRAGFDSPTACLLKGYFCVLDLIVEGSCVTLPDQISGY